MKRKRVAGLDSSWDEEEGQMMNESERNGDQLEKIGHHVQAIT